MLTVPRDIPVDSDEPDIDSLAERLDSIKAQIDNACTRAGRSPHDVTLVAVTKSFPISYVQAARRIGHLHFGENRAQELLEKATQVPGMVQGGEVVWHMIGHVQRNKARLVVDTTDVVHGLDSFRLGEALDERAARVERVLPCLVQVNTSGEASKAGVHPEAIDDLIARLEPLEHLKIVGLMTIALPVDDPQRVRPEFRLLRNLAERVARQHKHVEMRYLSMGMSGDFEVAIEEGATHVRIGTALFGLRELHV